MQWKNEPRHIAFRQVFIDGIRINTHMRVANLRDFLSLVFEDSRQNPIVLSFRLWSLENLLELVTIVSLYFVRSQFWSRSWRWTGACCMSHCRSRVSRGRVLYGIKLGPAMCYWINDYQGSSDSPRWSALQNWINWFLNNRPNEDLIERLRSHYCSNVDRKSCVSRRSTLKISLPVCRVNL